MKVANDVDLAAARAAAARLTGLQVGALEPVAGGGNNRVYRVECGAQRFALKRYAVEGTDVRDRLGHEFAALTFLRSAFPGAPVPRALAADRSEGFALYEWIEGERIRGHGLAEIDAVLALLRICHAATQHEGASGLQPASEAVFSASSLLDQVRERRARFAAVEDAALQVFLQDLLDPALERAAARSMARYEAAGWDPVAPIAAAARSLSPSDYGFHNALRGADGRLVFIDFEYFGWDDPVKLTADFVLHPGMALQPGERIHFLAGASDIYGMDHGFQRRLDAQFPLYALRWALIVLNEFLPAVWERRVLAGATPDWALAKRTQLAKAQAFVEGVQ